MLQSLFFKWIRTRFESVVNAVVELVNGKEAPMRYYHKEMLRKEFSPTMRWGSLTANGSIIAADVVAMDSSLPLKKRDAIEKVEGDIPKVGMKLYLNERTMNDLILLERMPGTEKEILKKLFADSSKCVQGVYEQSELMFLQGLSTGIALMDDEDRPGVGIRIDYGHSADNKFGVLDPWSAAGAKPIDDIDNVVSTYALNRDGNTIKYMLMDRATFNKFKKNTQVKELVAANMLFVGTQIPVPNLRQINEALNENYSLEIQIIDRTVRVEHNGVRKVIKPWADNVVVFLTDLQVGTLTYGTLAEESFPAKQVDYAKADDYILVSKYSTNDPIKEFTSSQALVVPVLQNVRDIYIMNVEESDQETQTESDSSFDYDGAVYTIASVVSTLNTILGAGTVSASNTDAELQDIVNQLSDEEIEEFEAGIIAV